MDGLGMRRYSNLYDVNISDINDVYKEIRKSVRNKNKIYRFEDYYSLNISKIKEVLDSGNYECGKYNIFLIREPKYRVIMSQNIFDKVINHIVARKFLYVLDKVLIDSNVATRKDKGTSLGVKYIKKLVLNFGQFSAEKKLYKDKEKYKNALFAIVKGAERTSYVC